MGIAAGEAVCRPISGSLIFEIFTPSGRGVANGIFSWGVYFGYGLAYVLGIYMTSANILDYGWRSVYVICALPGLVIGICIAIFLKDPKYEHYTRADNTQTQVCNLIFNIQTKITRQVFSGYNSLLHCVSGESILCQKFTFIKKSTILSQSLRNFVKMRYS